MTRERECLECGVTHALKGEFCSARCRFVFNNRRKQRGAELYDLYMAHRFERQRAQEAHVMQAINRLASNYRQEDTLRRAGRRSWRDLRPVLEERVYLRTIATYDGTGRRARG